MEPKAERLRLPSEYGNPQKLLAWADVRKDLEEAPVYWVASTRPDGRPHVVPRDGIWLDDAWYYGGSPKSIHNRNLQHNRSLAMHIGDGMKAVIVEGEAQFETPELATAEQLAAVNNTKYAHYGMDSTAATYSKGTWVLRPTRVLAWNLLFEDATRFVF